MSHPRTSLFSLALGTVVAGLALAPIGQARAVEGGTVFQVVGYDQKGPAVNNCLIVDDSGRASRRHWGQSSASNAICGFANESDLVNNGQAVFRILCVEDTKECVIENQRVVDGRTITKCLTFNKNTQEIAFANGSCTHRIPNNPNLFVSDNRLWLLQDSHGLTTIRPLLKPTHCLIFNNRGHEQRPSLYRWGNARWDMQWCGLGSRSDAYITGQVLFWMR